MRLSQEAAAMTDTADDREHAKSLAFAWTNGRKPIGHFIDDVAAALRAAREDGLATGKRQLDERDAEIARLKARVAELETVMQSVGHPSDDAATVNYLEVVRLRGLLADAKARCAALAKEPPR